MKQTNIQQIRLKAHSYAYIYVCICVVYVCLGFFVNSVIDCVVTDVRWACAPVTKYPKPRLERNALQSPQQTWVASSAIDSAFVESANISNGRIKRILIWLTVRFICRSGVAFICATVDWTAERLVKRNKLIW